MFERVGAFWTIPNVVTCSRIALFPIVLLFLSDGHFALAFFLVILSGFSDWLDGFLARRLDQCSSLGSALDPVADKLFLSGLFISLATEGYLPAWLAILVVGRDLLILCFIFVSYLLGFHSPLQPLFLGKLSTVAQFFLLAVCLGSLSVGAWFTVWVESFVIVVALLTTVSGMAYFLRWCFCVYR